jgi:predicted nucleotidyltransferase
MGVTGIEQKVRDALATAPPDILAVYLYGSQARGTARAGSDVDLAVLLARDPPRTLKGVARDLEARVESSLRLPVEVVVLNVASPDLVHRIMRDGIVLLDRDRAARLRFEVQSRNQYFDLAPLRRLYRRLPA